MTFVNLIKKVYEDREKQAARKIEYIKNGRENEPDAGIRCYSTDTRWDQYKAGTITREAAILYAAKRMARQLEKETAADVERINRIAAAPDANYIKVTVEWTRSSVWGMNPHAAVFTDADYRETCGGASGCGYDKESAAVGKAFYNNDSVMKILFTLEENRLATAPEAGRRDAIGYGSGYGPIPYFEGGVGVSCFWSILEKAGFKVTGDHGKTWDVYRLEKVEK